MNDLYDVAQGYDSVRSSVVFEVLRDTAEGVSEASVLRAVNLRDTAQIHSTADYRDVTVLRDLAEGVSILTSVQTWQSDSRDTAAAFDNVVVGSDITADLTTAAVGYSTADGPYPVVLMQDLGQAWSELEGNSASQPITLDSGSGWSRVSAIQSTDVQDLAVAESSVGVVQIVSGDAADSAAGWDSAGITVTRSITLQDLAQAVDALSSQTSFNTLLRDTAYAFSVLTSDGTLVGGASLADPIPLGLVYSAGMGWTCNTYSFALSAYTGDLTAGDIAAILVTGRQNFGATRSKRVSRVFTQHQSAEDLTLRVMADGREAAAAVDYTVPAAPGLGPETQRVVIGRGLSGDRWTFQVSGTAPFVLERFDVMMQEGNISHG